MVVEAVEHVARKDDRASLMGSRLFVSFSGGETSGLMTWMILNRGFADRYDDVRVLFANTGQEREETLEFVDRCDREFGFNVVWVEAKVHPGVRRAPTAQLVDFSIASRNGEPFEDVISKYGMPNPKFPSCTRDLKLRPMLDYLRRQGWAPGTYDTAIGIRVDEIDRMSSSAVERRLVYPLVQWVPTTKPQVNAWWAQQRFRLRLKGYEGNCTWCWKKSLRKHLTLMVERPEVFDFPERMERQYDTVGPEFSKPGLPPGYRRRFFREGRSVADLRMLAREGFTPATDDAVRTDVFDPRLDVGGGCEESCEVFADEDDGLD